MKKIIYFLLLSSQILLAQNAFETGNSLYKTGKYQDAIYEYESVLETNKQSAELYFNLANCYYKLNKVAPAIYNYEKALLLNPENIEAENNIQIARKLLIDDIKINKKVGFGKWFHKIINIYHYNVWSRISIYSSWLLLIFFIAYYYVNISILKRFFFTTMFAFMGLLIISLIFAVIQKSQYDNNKPAIVFAESTPLESAPNSSSKDIMILHEGTKVFILETKENYKKVQLTDDRKGWIVSTAIKELNK